VRGYFVVGSLIVAAIITPPGVGSQLALAIPMCLLYEIGIWAAQLLVRKKALADKEAESETSTPT